MDFIILWLFLADLAAAAGWLLACSARGVFGPATRETPIIYVYARPLSYLSGPFARFKRLEIKNFKIFKIFK